MIRFRAAFTLVEVIVVMAILALLAAMLFPVFVSANRAAKRSGSIQNLRQLHYAFTIYRDEWEGSSSLGGLGLPPLWPGGIGEKSLPHAKDLWFTPCDKNEDGGTHTLYGPGKVKLKSGPTISGLYSLAPELPIWDQWLDYHAVWGDASVYLMDLHCNDPGTVLGSPLYPYRVNVLRLNGQAETIWKTGGNSPTSGF